MDNNGEVFNCRLFSSAAMRSHENYMNGAGSGRSVIHLGIREQDKPETWHQQMKTKYGVCP